MVTIKVKFRKSTVANRPGTIYYHVSHAKSSKQITTNMHIFPKDWDEEQRQICSQADSDKELQKYQRKIEDDLRLLHRISDELESGGAAFDAREVVRRFHSAASRITVLAYMKQQIAALRERKKLGTATNYQCALNSFSAFLGKKDISFHYFTEDLIIEYGDWLREREVMKNSLSFYMRIWRAVYNRAVKEKIVEQMHPFQKVYTGVDHTRKRAVDESTIFRLLALDLSKSPSLALSRDLFVFSYCTRGMAFVDLAFLKKRNINNHILTYYRRKTDQLMSIRMEPCIEAIIKHYEPLTQNSEYVFPILRSKKVVEQYRQYNTALGYHNRKLKKIAEMAGIETALTSYTSRHTWATTARNHNVPISIISAGMGHSSERTTQIYLASLENSVIDDANSQLLTEINKMISV